MWITWDLDRCVGCQVGAEICPHEAITHVDAELGWMGGWSTRQGVDIDPEKCIFCGMCAVMCPVQRAITMLVNGWQSQATRCKNTKRFRYLRESNTKFKKSGQFDWEPQGVSS